MTQSHKLLYKQEKCSDCINRLRHKRIHIPKAKEQQEQNRQRSQQPYHPTLGVLTIHASAHQLNQMTTTLTQSQLFSRTHNTYSL